MSTDADKKWVADTAEIVALELAFGTHPQIIADTLRTLPGHLIAQLRATGHGDLARSYTAAISGHADNDDAIIRGEQ